MRQWDINVNTFGKYQLVEITDHSRIPWDTYNELSLSLIHQIALEYQNMIVCQLIDPDQRMDVNEFQLDRLEKEYSLQTATGKGYCRINNPEQPGREITVFAAGKSDISWLRKILSFGGSSLPHIIYGIYRLESNWLETVEPWNRIFIKWYWLESDDSEIIRLREKVKGLIWTSDNHLNVLLDENEVVGFLQKVQTVAKRYDLIPHIESGG